MMNDLMVAGIGMGVMVAVTCIVAYQLGFWLAKRSACNE